MSPARPDTLADLDGPQAPSIVAAIGVVLIAALETSTATGAALLPGSIALDADGAPELGDRGERLADLSDDDQAYVAPEVWVGAAPSAASDLYGLGVLLYRLATGQPPRFNPGRPGPPPPPASLRPDLPAALDRAILTLLDSDPSRRRQALADLHDAAGALPDLRRLSATPPTSTTPSRVGVVKYTTTPSTSPTAAAADPALRTLLAVPAASASALTPADRSAIAGRTGAPLAAVESLIAEGRPVPVQAGLRSRTDVADAPSLPAVPVSPAGVGLALGATALTLLGGAGVLLGLALAVISLGVGLGLAAVALLPLIGSLLMWLLWARGRAEYLSTARSWRALTEAAEAAESHPLTGEAWVRLTGVRSALSLADLPELAEVDLRDGLRAVESELERLGQRWSATEQAHAAASGEDAQALQARRSTLRDEAARIEHSLAELAELVGRAAHPTDDGAPLEHAMDRVLTAARLAAEAVGADDPRRRAAAATREPA